ncbi:MAG: Superoxide dismutase [Fe] [Holosporales bacterium]
MVTIFQLRCNSNNCYDGEESFYEFKKMYEIEPLRFERKVYESLFTPEMFALHYDKHHMGYVKKLNELIKDTPYDEMSLEAIISSTHKRTDPLMVKIFNNAAQVFNHNQFWGSVCPGGEFPDVLLFADIIRVYETYGNFKAEFKKAALEIFGSGWVWAIWDNRVHQESCVRIVTTQNGEIPYGEFILLVCDVWEHAYYPKFKNDRAAFVDSFLNMVDWKFAVFNLNRMTRIKLD